MRFTHLLIASFSFAALINGCAADEPTDTEAVSEVQQRQKLGKADIVVGSCAAPDDGDYCGAKPDAGNCYCDDACPLFEDCCSDYKETCFGGDDGGGGGGGGTCDPTLFCTQVLTCVDDKLYPTGCGPANCDQPIGDCGDDSGGNTCDPTLFCTQVLTCVDDKLYPTGCGPANCDQPIGDCGDGDGNGGTCDPTLICTQVLTCVGDELYPTGCGPANCDQPIGDC